MYCLMRQGPGLISGVYAQDKVQEMFDNLESENPFEYTRTITSDQHKPMTRFIRRMKGNSESEDNKVLLPLDLAILPSCSANKDGANIRQRRKAQNRASQRAFRERKLRHTEDLQQQLEKLHETHQCLLETYKQNVDELSNMKAYVDELNFEITMLQMRPDFFDDFESTGAGKAVKFEPRTSYFDPQSATDFNTSLDWAVDHSDMEAALRTHSMSSLTMGDQ